MQLVVLHTPLHVTHDMSLNLFCAAGAFRVVQLVVLHTPLHVTHDMSLNLFCAASKVYTWPDRKEPQRKRKLLNHASVRPHALQ